VAPPGVPRAHAVSAFNRKVLIQQPLNVLTAWYDDSVKLFAVKRATSPGDTPIWRWQFQDNYPTYNQAVGVNPDGAIVVGLRFQSSGGPFKYQTLDPSLGGKATVVKPLANFLRHYQLHGGYTPGPVYLFTVLAGLIGSLSLFLRRRPTVQRRQAWACLVFFTSAVAVLVVADLFEFSWRYQLPALVTLPLAGALGVTVIVAEIRRRRTGEPQQDTAGQVPELTAQTR
jgi:hypothetical protein